MQTFIFDMGQNITFILLCYLLRYCKQISNYLFSNSWKHNHNNINLVNASTELKQKFFHHTIFDQAKIFKDSLKSVPQADGVQEERYEPHSIYSLKKGEKKKSGQLQHQAAGWAETTVSSFHCVKNFDQSNAPRNIHKFISRESLIFLSNVQIMKKKTHFYTRLEGLLT